MKIALFNTMSPFVRGGAEILVDDLHEQLLQRGHSVALFRIPFPENYETGLLRLVTAAKILDFSDYDAVISFKFPAYCAVHRKNVLWFFHQFRQVYELFGTEYGIANDETGRALKEIITQIDTISIGSAAKAFTNAYEVTNRLKKYNGLDSEVLNPPLQQAHRYHCNDFGDYIYYPSRITNLKRQHLAIQAMKHVKTKAKLYIDGRCSEPDYLDKLKELIRKNHVEQKVVLNNSWVSDKEKIEKMADCLAVMYIPLKEDSCGFVTMEGFYSSKPVISCLDSGGTKEFIEDGVTGLFAEPDPFCIAKCIDTLCEDKAAAKKMGQNALQYITDRNITWDETIRRLLT
jgi:glycosyltransferase involved in cell wall biosynthesis